MIGEEIGGLDLQGQGFGCDFGFLRFYCFPGKHIFLTTHTNVRRKTIK